MRLVGFQLALYFAAILPVLLVAASSLVWWGVLARPWMFVAVAFVALYVLLAVFVVALIFIGPGFGGYFLEAPSPSNASHSDSTGLVETIAAAVYVLLGVRMLWVLKQWLQQP